MAVALMCQVLEKKGIKNEPPTRWSPGSSNNRTGDLQCECVRSDSRHQYTTGGSAESENDICTGISGGRCSDMFRTETRWAYALNRADIALSLDILPDRASRLCHNRGRHSHDNSRDHSHSHSHNRDNGSSCGSDGAWTWT